MKQIIKKCIRIVLECICYYFIPKRTDSVLSCERAEERMNRHSPDPHSSCLRKNQDKEKVYDLSIVVPVYNAEAYLDQCIRSLLNQKTKYHYEIIVVNDGSTDNSARILQGYSQEKNIVILSQKNQGHSGARNSGIQVVQGKYIMFVDSDDFVPEDVVEVLLNATEKYQADMIQGGYYHVSQNGSRCLATTKYKDEDSVPPNGVVAGMVCGKVYRTKLFENICFPEGYWYEDTIVTSILTHLANRVATISDIVYYYRQNADGITKTSVGKPKSIDTFYVLRSVMEARRTLGMETDNAFYEHLLRLIILSYQRTKNEPDPVKRSIFSLFRKMLEEERAGKHFVLHGTLNRLDKAITSGDYRRYCFLCALP